MSNPLIAQFAGGPALVEPTLRERFEMCLAQAAAHPMLAEAQAAAGSSDQFWPTEDSGSWAHQLRPYVVKDGILHIPVKGVLLHNFPYALFDWATGYEYIWQAFKRGCADFAIGQIRGIALICDTPGGMVAGCFDARDKMVALKEETGVPVAGFAHESAYSAGYAIITVADPGQVHVSRTGGVGSIGVVTSHMNAAGMMDRLGLQITFIASDASKVEGNPYEALSPEAKARIQARVDELYSIFVAAVSQSRSLSEEVIRSDLKAYCYTATQAVSNGLADTIGSLEDAMSAFAGFLDDQSDNNGDENMAEPANTSAVDQAAVDAAREEGRVAGHTAGRTEGLTEGATAERTRIGAILGSEEAKGRDSLAQHFAFKTGQSAEDAIAALAAAPAAQAPASEKPQGKQQPTSFAEAMDNGAQPNVGATTTGEGDGDDEDDGSEVVALAARVGIKGFAALTAK